MTFTKPMLSLCAILLAAPAHADITVITHTSFAGGIRSGLTNPQAQAALEKYSNSTTYIAAHKMRMDSAAFSIISDMDAHKMYMLNPVAHTYTVTAYTAAQMKEMMAKITKSPAGGGAGLAFHVTDTGRTSKVLGHTARHYIMTMTMNVMGHPMTTRSDILAAQDIPVACLGVYGAMASGFGARLHGLPLVTKTKMTGGPAGGMTVTQTVTSLKMDPIPASFFEVPAGFTKTDSKDLMTPPMSPRASPL